MVLAERGPLFIYKCLINVEIGHLFDNHIKYWLNYRSRGLINAGEKYEKR
jgi:hypothetical protein